MISVSTIPALPRVARMFKPLCTQGSLQLSSGDHTAAIGQRQLTFLESRKAVAGGFLDMAAIKKIDPRTLCREFRDMPMREQKPDYQDYLGAIVGRLTSSDNRVSIYGDHHGDALSAIQHLFSGRQAQFKGLVEEMLRDVHLDLSGGVFDRMFMENLPLAGANFRKGSFRDVIMRNVNLYGAHFPFADFSRAVVLDSDMAFTDMHGTVLKNMIVARTKLTENFGRVASNADELIFIDCPRVQLK